MRARRGWVAVALAGLVTFVVSSCSVPDLNVLPAPAAVDGSTYHLGADFEDALNLPLGAKVKQSGTVIGEVTAIRTENFAARIDMDISTKVKLPVGTKAQIRFNTPLGEDFVAIYPPTVAKAGYLRPNTVLSEADTSGAPTIEDAFAALSLLLNGGGIDQISTIVHELDVTLTGRTDTIRTVLNHMHQLVGALNSHRDDIDNALTGLHRLAVTLGAGDDVINRALDEFPAALRIVAGQTAKLNVLLTHVQRFAGVTTGVVNRTTDNLLADLDELRPALRSLVSVRGAIVPTMQTLTAFGRNIDRATPGDYVLANGTFSIAFGGKALLPQNTSSAASGQAAVRRMLVTGIGPGAGR